MTECVNGYSRAKGGSENDELRDDNESEQNPVEGWKATISAIPMWNMEKSFNGFSRRFSQINCLPHQIMFKSCSGFLFIWVAS
jgi:hypothetical protein